MLSLETESRLSRALLKIADHELQIENLRVRLAEERDFEPYTTFKRIDRDGKGWISTSDLINFMDDNNIYISHADSLVLLKLYDFSGNGKIDYKEFSYSVLPQNNTTWKGIANGRGSYFVGRNELLPIEVEDALSRLLERELQLYKDMEVDKEVLAERYDFNVLDAFRSIDIDRYGYVDYEALRIFFDRNREVAYTQDIEGVVRRFDRDGDDRISYSEFREGILPNIPAHRSSNYTSYSRRYRYYDDSYMSPQRRASPSRLNTSPSRSRFARSLGGSPTRRWESPARNNVDSPSKTTSSFAGDRYSTPTKGMRAERSSSPVRKSPLRPSDENELVRALKEQVNLDKDLEGVKQDLSLRADFNLLDAFRIFDINGKGYATSFDLEDALKVYDIFPSRDELYLVFRKYDKNNDGRWRYSDFCDAFTPKSAEYSSLLQNRRPFNSDNYYRREEVFSFETKLQFKKLLRFLVDSEIAAEDIRQKLADRPNFNVYDAFKFLDKNDSGKLTMDEFYDTLREAGNFVSSKDLEMLMERYDKNKDGKVSYSDFMNEIAPKSPTRA